MNEVSKPPPWQTLAAATAGGFIGAVGGAVVAANMLGEPSGQARVQEPEPQEQVLVAENEK
ncbi:MAG: hypothetical protein QNJ00_13035 [Woeseiaceae bacterium]|nr:hypothetical protein [Woeseiaceae bacterium]